MRSAPGRADAASADSLLRRLHRTATVIVALVALPVFGVVHSIGRAQLVDELDAALQEDWVALAGQVAAVQARIGASLQPQAWFDTVSFRPDYQPGGERFYEVLDPRTGQGLAASPSVSARGLVLGTAALAGDAPRRFEASLPDGTRVSLLSRQLPVVGVQPERPAEPDPVGASAEPAVATPAGQPAVPVAGAGAGSGAAPAAGLHRVDPVLLVGRTHAALDERLAQLAWACAAGALLLPLLAAGLLGWSLPVVLGPLRALSQAAARRGEAAAGMALPHAHLRELRPIVDRLDRLAADNEACRHRERHLLDDTAQALRTPLAELQALADVTLLRTHDARLQAEAMGQVRRIAQRLNGEVDLLFLLARHAGGTPLVLRPVALAELVGASLAELRPAVEGRALRWLCEGEAEVQVRTDQVLAQALLDSLLAQVLAHARPGAEVRVAWGREPGVAGRASITIGIGPDERERVAELGAALSTARRAAQALGVTLHLGGTATEIGLRLGFALARPGPGTPVPASPGGEGADAREAAATALEA